MDPLADLEPHFAWLAIGLVLAVAEMAVPGVFLIWMAGAAVLTGMVTWLTPIGLPAQVAVFAVLSIVAVFAGRRYLAAHPVVAADPALNHRAARAIGQTVVVTQAIEGGAGRVRLGDGEWLARAEEDVAAGTRLTVTGVEGTTLLVGSPTPATR